MTVQICNPCPESWVLLNRLLQLKKIGMITDCKSALSGFARMSYCFARCSYSFGRRSFDFNRSSYSFARTSYDFDRSSYSFNRSSYGFARCSYSFTRTSFDFGRSYCILKIKLLLKFIIYCRVGS